MKVLTNLDFNQVAQLVKVKIQNATTAQQPATTKGGLYYNTTEDELMWSDGTTWHPITDVSDFINLLSDGNGINFSESGGITTISVDAIDTIFKFTTGELDIVDGGIKGTHIANSANSALRAIDTNHIKDNAVEEAQIANNAVTTDKIANNAVSLAKLAKMNKLTVIGRDHSSETAETPTALPIDVVVEEKTHDNSVASTKAIKSALDTIAGQIPTYTGGDGIDVTGTVISVEYDTAQFEIEDNRKLKILKDGITGTELASHASTDANRAVNTDHIRNGAVDNTKIADTTIQFGKLASALVDTSLAGTFTEHTTIPTTKAVKDYITSEIGDFGNFKGGFNANTATTFPAESEKGDYWYVDTAGTVQGVEFTVGSLIISKQDDASTTNPDHWVFLISKMGEATTSKLGLVKYASQAEVDAHTADDKVVRPSTLKSDIDTSGTTITETFGLDIKRKHIRNIGNNTATELGVEHGFNTKDVSVEVYDNSNDDTVWADVTRTNANTVTIGFAFAPATNAYRVVVTA